MRVRTEHWQLLLTLCENNPELITNKFNGVEGKARGNALWQTVATKLNSLGFGEKNVEGWRKALTDWKSKTKGKAAAIKREMQKTGGGPKASLLLSALEEKLLMIMGTKTIMGDEDVPELGFGKITIPKMTMEDEVTVEVVPEQNSSTHNVEHDYDGQHSSDSTGYIRKRRKIETTSQTPKKSQRHRPNQSMHLSGELLQLNNKTVNLLNSISDNTDNIAHSLEIIANVIQKHFS